MDIENKIVYVFNKYLIQFFKEIKKDDYLKIAIKKNYKVIDKNSSNYINEFKKNFEKNENIEMFLSKKESKEEVLNILDNTDESLQQIKLFKNINLKKLKNFYKDNSDKLLMYYNSFLLFTTLYIDCIDSKNMFYKKKESNENKENVEEIITEDDDNENNDDDDDDDDDDDNDDDNLTPEMEYAVIQKSLDDLLVYCLKVINNINNDNLPEEGIMDEEIEILVHNIKLLDISISDENNEEKMTSMLEESKIGKLAKEISEGIDFSGLDEEKLKNIKNPMDVLQNGDFLGNIINQVGSTITNKMTSGELNQEDLMKDAFSLMGGLQKDIGNNPLFSDILNNMTNNNTNNNTNNADNTGLDNIGDLFKNLSSNLGNMDLSQMQNAMGGTNAMNQNNPNSRENKMRQKLQKKLNEKK